MINIHSLSLFFLLAQAFLYAYHQGGVVRAFPLPLSILYRNTIMGPVKTLTSSEIAAFQPYAHYAAAGYCDPSITRHWECGQNCEGNAHFIPVASGGDGADVQFWYVGIDNELESVIVGHEGTDPSKILPLITILDMSLEALDDDLFPGLSPLIEVHAGFRKSHAKTAMEVLDAVRKALTLTHHRKVTTVGHSLGAAIAVLDSLYLPLFIPGITIHTVGYGTPRVGNWAFAEYVDRHANLTRVNNRRDVVPILPGLMLGYQHPGGERHILQDGSWVSCSAHDNEDFRCTTGDVDDIFEADLTDHDGPYEGIEMTC